MRHTDKYQLVRPLRFVRPATGVVFETVACGYCRAEIRVKVASKQETRRSRLRSLGMAVGCLVAALPLALLAILVFTHGWPQVLALPIILVVVVLLIVFFGGLGMSLTDSGIEWAPDTPKTITQTHSLLITQ